jgi:four helix bundle protein
MGRILRFEDIEAWQDARELTNHIYRCCRDSALARDFGLRDQVQRAPVSIMANIAEGFGRQRNTEFIQYLRLAAGSCAEVQPHLYVARDNNLISETDFEALQKLALKASRKISAFCCYLTSLNQQNK